MKSAYPSITFSAGLPFFAPVTDCSVSVGWVEGKSACAWNRAAPCLKTQKQLSASLKGR